MKKLGCVLNVFLLWLIPFHSVALDAEIKEDSVPADKYAQWVYRRYGMNLGAERVKTRGSFPGNPRFVSFKYSGGTVLETDETFKNLPYAQYGEVRLGFSALGNDWKDIAYGMPYHGLGIGFYDFGSKVLGNPIAIYLLHGGTLKAFTPSLRLKYEWNLGCSFNWNKYDPVTNPNNKSIGADANVYFAGNVYVAYVLSNTMDLNLGVSLSHSSNGATRMPNSGINALTGFASLSYHFDRDRITQELDPFQRPPVYENSRLISDIMVHATSRQRKFPTEISGLSSKYINHSFFVTGISYSLLYMPGYKYRYGIGVDMVYDESAGFSAYKAGERADGSDIKKVYYGDFHQRIALGISIRGEMVLPKYVVSVQAGYDVIEGVSEDPRWYQAFGVKIPVWKNLYGAMLIRAMNLSKAQYLQLGVGYLIDHK